MSSDDRYGSRTVVLKLGGSLLDVEDLWGRLRRVVDRYRSSQMLLVVGGGEAADLVRNWDHEHRLGNEIAHRLALEAMSFNARFVCSVFSDADLVTSLQECEASWQQRRLPTIDAARFVPALEATTGESVPQTWGVTSDSLSAWIADCIEADRLVLLKSVDCQGDGTVAAGCELVDHGFSVMSGRLRRIEWINLRSEFAEPRRVQFV